MHKVNVLLVDDNPGDVWLIVEAFKSNRFKTQVHVVHDGVEALSFLHQQGTYSDEVLPDMILLDLHLPLKDGHEVLAEIKIDDKLKQIPVVILTSSNHPQDIQDCYEHHANSYIVKPPDMDTFLHMVKGLEDFWFRVAQLPELPYNTAKN